MKKLLLIGFMALGVTVALGQETVKITRNITLYAEPSLNSITYTTVFSGSRLMLGEKTGEFRIATYKKNVGYIHQSSYAYCVSDTAMAENSRSKTDLFVGKIKVRPYESFMIYPRPSLNSLTHIYVDIGSTLYVGAYSDGFYEVVYKDKLHFMPESSQDYCVPFDEPMKLKVFIPTPEYITTPGEDFEMAGKSLLIGAIVPSIGAGLGLILAVVSENPLPGLVVSVGCATAGSVLMILGYTKISQAGKKLSFGATSSGIGLSFNLNK
jgi:hypothetical protein